MNGLIIGKKYVLSTPVDTVITDVKYNIPLGTVKAGQQFVFQAVSDAVTVADGCTIRPFEGSNGASVGVVGGSGDGGSGGSSAYPGWVGYIELDDETGEAIAADYSGLEGEIAYGLNFKTNYKFRGDWDGDIPKVTECMNMFDGCTNLTSFTGDLSSLINSECMFQKCTNLTSFTGDLSSLTHGGSMFNGCKNLAAFNSDLGSLIKASSMFKYCVNITSFTSDLSSLSEGTYMFDGCSNLTNFNSDLSSLTDGGVMFNGCKLNKESVIGIITCLKERNTCNTSATLMIGVDKQHKNDPELLQVLGITSWASSVRIVGHGGATWTISLQAN